MATPPLDVPALGEGVLGRAVGKLPGGQRLPPLARLGVTFLVLALLVLAAALTDPWGFIALGSAVGMLVVASVPAAQVGLRPLTALGVAALPLFLPLLVFVAAGVVKSPKELQFAVGLTTLLAAWFGLVKPDWKRIRAVVRPDSRWWSTKVTRAQVGAPALVVALVLAFLGYSIVGVVGDSDQTARRLFIVAVGFLAGSAVLRLLSYGRTLFRALVALAIVLLLARLAIEVGVIAGVNFLEDADVAVLAAVAGGLLALAAGVEIVTTLLTRDAADQAGLASDRLPRGFRLAVLVETPVAARWLTDRAAVAGLFSALLSAVFMLCAVFDASSAGGADEDPAGTPSAG